MNEKVLGSLAVALAAFFAGAATYITVAEQPARLLLDQRGLLLEWQTSYLIGMKMQGSIAIATGLAGIWAWWHARDWRWLIGAMLILANWPFTLIALGPINAELLALAPESAGDRSRALIEQWGTLHAVRSALGLLAAGAFLWALNRRQHDRVVA